MGLRPTERLYMAMRQTPYGINSWHLNQGLLDPSSNWGHFRWRKQAVLPRFSRLVCILPIYRKRLKKFHSPYDTPIAPTSSVPCLRGGQDQNLNVTRKIFLEALGVINSCVKRSFWGKVFRAHWKLINSCSQVQQQERRGLP